MVQKRDSAYFEMRLRNEHASVFAALKSGRFKSVREAAAAAGLIKLPGRLEELKRHWLKASAAEKKSFEAWVSLPAPAPKPAIVIDAFGMLTAEAVAHLEEWTKSNRLRPGRIMKAIGFKVYDYRLAQAMRRRWRIEEEIVAPLTNWMLKNGFR